MRKAYEARFMDGLCNIWRLKSYGNNNNGRTFDFGDAPAYSDVPCKLRQPQGDKIDAGLPELEGILVVPITYLGQIDENDRVELTTNGTEALPESITFALKEAPRPIATGLSMRVERIHGEASNE